MYFRLHSVNRVEGAGGRAGHEVDMGKLRGRKRGETGAGVVLTKSP